MRIEELLKDICEKYEISISRIRLRAGGTKVVSARVEFVNSARDLGYNDVAIARVLSTKVASVRRWKKYGS